MKEDIVINGVSVNELKKQRDAIREGASKIISENIDLAKTLTQQLVESEDPKVVERLAQEAYDALDTANIISGVSGVTFYLPFYEEYRDEDTYSSMLEEAENEVVSENWDGAVRQLYNLFYEMESQSRDWHSSRC